jgi:hypothetical protein
MDVECAGSIAGRLASTRVFCIPHDPAAPGKRVDPFAAGEHVAEVRLITEPAFEADLRKAQVRVLDQQFGAGDALLANPLLRREAGAALEGAGEVTA